MRSYLHPSVVEQFLWNGDQLVSVSRDIFERVEQGQVVSIDGKELTLNYLLIVKDDEDAPEAYDIGAGHVWAPFVTAVQAEIQKRIWK